MNLTTEIGKTAAYVAAGHGRQAIKYLSKALCIKATRRGKLDKRDKTVTVLVTIGKPAFREREFIKWCVKAKEPFPVRKLQVRG